MQKLALLAPLVAAEQLSEGANPIRRVVTLLQNLQKEVEAEGDAEEKNMEKFSCFCKKNTAGMTDAATKAKDKIVQLRSQISADESNKKKTDGEVVEAKSDRASAQDTIKKQTAQRKKEAAAYAALLGDAKANIDAVTRAIAVIRKGTSLVQMPSSELARVRRVAVSASMDQFEKQSLMSFLGMNEGSPYGDYQASSGEITGILEQMKDQMDKDLGGAISEEENKVKTFNELIKSQEDQIAAATKAIERKTVLSGDLAVSAAEGKADLKNTEAALAENEKFMANLSIACDDKSTEWADRQQTRANEIAAIADAIKFLNDDDALEVFKKTLPSPGMALLQVKHSKKVMNRAYSLVSKAAKSNPRLSLLVAMMKQGKVSFDKVLKMIDDMVKLLGKEQVTDDQQLEVCNKDVDSTEDMIKETKHKIEGQDAKIEEHNGAIESLKAEIAELQTSIATSEEAVADASAQRKTDNAEFVKESTENNAAVQLIEKAKNRLQKFYNPNLYKEAKPRELSDEDRVYQNLGGELATPAPELIAGTTQTVFMQVNQPVAPKTFGAYKKNQKSGGIVALMDMLIKDVKQSQTEAEKDEEHDSKDYNKMMGSSKKQLKADSKALTNANSMLAEKETKLSDVNTVRSSTKSELTSYEETEAGLHKSCDWLVNNFDLRKESRRMESESLKNAKAVLKGADYS